MLNDTVAFGQARKHGGVAPVPPPDLDHHPFDAIPVGAEHGPVIADAERAAERDHHGVLFAILDDPQKDGKAVSEISPRLGR